MKDDKCQACGIAVGGKEQLLGLIDYRGHRICNWCWARWKNKEKLAGYNISFEKFRKGEV